MFESIVADIIVRYIGEYIKNLSSEQLRINIFSGNVVLKNLEIKGEALQSFKLPLHVQKGIIGSLELKIPWTNLKSAPVILEIDSICLYAIPQTGFEYNEEEERRKTQLEKQKKLEKYELIRTWKDGAADARAGRQDSFMSGVMSKILNNIEIKINTFHLRYEEVRNGKVYSLGLSFGSLSAYSTDRHYKRAYVGNSSESRAVDNDTLFKYVELTDFSIYLNSDDHSIRDLSNTDFQQALKNMTGSSTALGDHRYILKPITVTLKVEINKNLSMDMDVPKLRIKCQFEEVSFFIEENQYQTILKLLTTIGNYAHELKYLKYRPKLRPKQDPRAWWRYCAEVYRESIRKKIQQRSWSYIQRRRQDRKEYVQLFKKLQGVEWVDAISDKETKRLQEMEDELGFEDIVYFRSLARRELAKEQAIADSKKGEFYSSVNRTRSLFGFWNTGSTPRLNIQLTKEQQDEIYKSMEYDEVALSATVEMPADYVQHIVQVKVQAIVFTVVGSRKGEDPLMISYLNNITFKMSQREQGVRFDLDLESFNVVDHFSPDSLFPYIITSKPRYKLGINDMTVAKMSPPNQERHQHKGANKKQQQHLFNIVFETNPIASNYDYRLSLLLNTMEVVINKPQIERLIEFATPEESVNLFPLSSVAVEELIMLKEMTIFQLREVINHHKTIDLSVDAKAPTVIIPEHANRPDTTLIIVDLGNCLMQSDVADTKAARNKRSTAALDRRLLTSTMVQEDLDHDLDESDLYDHYRVNLSSIKVQLARNDQQWWNVKAGSVDDDSNNNGFPLVEEMAINLHIQTSIESNELSLALFKVSGTLPEVRVNISDSSFVQLYRMARTLSTESSHTSNAYNQIMDTLYTTSKQQEESVLDLSHMEVKLSEAYRQVLSRRKLFEGEFTLQKVFVNVHTSSRYAAISGASSKQKQSRLTQLRIHELQLSVKKQTYDYMGTLLLSQMEIEDCLEQNTRFSSLVTSQPRNKANASKNLISITHHIVEKDSPKYEGIDVFIDFNFGELNVNYNSKSIGQVISFMDFCLEDMYRVQDEIALADKAGAVTLLAPASPATSTSSEPAALSPSPSKPRSNSVSLAKQQQQALAVTPSVPANSRDRSSVLRAKANVHSLSISLNDDGKEIGLLSINRLVVSECTTSISHIEIEGRLDSITIESFVDLPPGMVEGQSFKILTPANQDVAMATFKYRAYTGRAMTKRVFDTEIELDLRSIRATVLVDFILRTKYLLQQPFKDVKYASLYRYQNQAEASGSALASASEASPATTDDSSDDAAHNANNHQQQQQQHQNQLMDMKAKKTNFKVFLESPQLVLSSKDTLSTDDDDKIIAELGSIHVDTTLRRATQGDEEVEWESISAKLRDMNLKTCKAGRYHQVLNNVSVDATVDTLLCWAKTQRPVAKDLVPTQRMINVEINEISLEFEDLEHALINNITRDVIDKVSMRTKEHRQNKQKVAAAAIVKRKPQVVDGDAITSIVNVDLRRFALSLQAADSDLSQISLSHLNFKSFNSKNNTTNFAGSIQSFSLSDLRPDKRNLPLFSSVFSPLPSSEIAPKDAPHVTFSMKEQQQQDPAPVLVVTLDIAPSSITASAGFILALKDFFLLPFVAMIPEDMGSLAHPCRRLFVCAVPHEPRCYAPQSNVRAARVTSLAELIGRPNGQDATHQSIPGVALWRNTCPRRVDARSH
ncbi:hypothetical protein SAMD00019534_087810 [Acytostelium subglobosum LB1]|uniref:hypothetical protein n=1 Tax=Acytostelium subglobosum LB1 TaxID=1410327 RepID=UPI00064496A7|nr:hypothetical protein SAMD00019534_087810 [Acytostelium subglobosum LB1]GAM25606.1 hypothetical protein SAMD00019534_087810 [Acytostelium subglobosum LB1]|eukprot:XP_012751592.1 hypothetical protein SAMD00019534_087810 [Acytostelium subglobosum LB1]